MAWPPPNPRDVKKVNPMTELTPLPFEYTQGSPAVVKVTMPDGSTFEVRVAITVFSVHDRHASNPEGIPIFEVRAGIALDTRRSAP